ncbi:MAG: SPOR domain-containing protein [Candidatus Zixiibacteriota bacterium]|nr:MAG: SPOR domain-containing protein [candidate division Zixibacteria bacterium]
MKTSFILILIVGVLAFFAGCSKDEEVADLEREVKEAESKDYLADTGIAVEAVVPADTVAPEQYAMTPEKAPEESAAEPLMPRHLGTEGFTIQIAAGSNPEYVKYLADKYTRRGYDAFVTEAVVGDVTFYRVRIGTFETIAEAKETGLILQDKYSVDFWIDNVQ